MQPFAAVQGISRVHAAHDSAHLAAASAPLPVQVALLCGPRRPHVLVATPGRLLDLVDGGHLALKVRIEP